ncbi:MAG: thioredoxin domain-containing protein [Candidatus Aminicenantes bacterium]|nr:thioredoxin domain-containing protein [Candidatus Aminicenantes bacterium]
MYRLAGSKSLYLRQHADNPVDWHPWGPEAFAKASQEDKPVFLSIGYSSCHWCHVMEGESFRDAEVAGLLNASFVAVKVDREERPDLDHHFMAVCQALTGGGGWPLTVVLTPDRKPFFAGTYFPKTARSGRPGLIEILPRLAEAWRSRRADVLRAAGEIVRATAPSDSLGDEGGLPGVGLITAAAARFGRAYDSANGGFGGSPKFPSPHVLIFLLRAALRTGDPGPRRMAEETLVRMRRGGIFDHLGFGFHRYSTDARWRVPHFEKMLTDQGMLLLACGDAFQATQQGVFRATAAEIADYLRLVMTSPEGGFYTAEDADAEGEEGAFYLWTEDEMKRILSPRDAAFALRHFGVSASGNFEDAENPGSGRNVLFEAVPAAGEEEERRLGRVRRSLFAARERRPRPLKDTKILADGNGLAIAGLAKAAAAAFLDDYAFMIWGLIELYEAAFEPGRLAEALSLARRAVDLFEDRARGGFFFTDGRGSDLPIRRKETYDGAYPSGNAAMMLNLLRLGRMTGEVRFEDAARRAAEAFAGPIVRYPTSHAHWLSGIDFAAGPGREVVVVGRPGAADAKALLAAVRSVYDPRRTVLFKSEGEEGAEIARLAPFLEEMNSVGGRAAAYVCSGFACRTPTTDPDEFAAELRALAAGKI